MLLINKGKEPNSLIEYKKQADACYENFRDKDDIRDALLRDQGYLCAYCMKRIDKSNMKIEHYKPQSKYGDLDLDYRNMLGVCDRNSKVGDNKKEQICDTHKGNYEIVVNPLEQSSIDLIKYKNDGTIYSDDEVINKDLNETLNLNCDAVFLKSNRKEALDSLKKFISKKSPDKTCSNDLLIKIKRMYEAFDADGKRKPFSGIILYYLNKRIK